MGRWRVPVRLWRLVALATTVVGSACAVVVWGPWGPVCTVIGIFVVVVLVSLSGANSIRASVRTGWMVSVVVVACGGLLAGWGWSGALLLLLVVVASPFTRVLVRTGRVTALMRAGTLPDEMAIHRQQGWFHDAEPVFNDDAGGSHPLYVLADMPTGNVIATLDDHALCEAWRRSYVRLEACATVGSKHKVVTLRQLYLDELVRRHPTRTRQWLEAGARAAGNPLPFLERPVPQRRPPPTDPGTQAG